MGGKGLGDFGRRVFWGTGAYRVWGFRFRPKPGTPEPQHVTARKIHPTHVDT